MRTTIELDDPRFMNHLGENHDVVRGLEQLHVYALGTIGGPELNPR